MRAVQPDGSMPLFGTVQNLDVVDWSTITAESGGAKPLYANRST
ncbi:hypothetical protein [Phytohabitans rumicis]